MNTPNAKITYLFHSGYAVETENHLCIFDYYQPSSVKKSSIADGIIKGKYLQTEKKVMVFVSHNHADHFDPIILEWANDNPAITYILSSDVEANMGKAKYHVMSAYEEIHTEDVAIKAFGSTDQGISFLMQVDGLSIFHAGDLNWWHWSGESLEEREYAERAFKAEIDKITGQTIDIAFFPVDRRLEEFYAIGAEYFADKLRPKLLLPMHFGEDYAATSAFAKKAKTISINTCEITHKGQEIFF